jgi:dTDP-4-amino-4,6-dideoxygalactose transaminase
LNPDDVIERITPKTRAIMPIHYGGCPCMIQELREIADDHDLLLIEDPQRPLERLLAVKKLEPLAIQQ